MELYDIYFLAKDEGYVIEWTIFFLYFDDR